MAVGRLRDSIKKSLSTFSGWAMSIMFFGMAIQRTFTNIAKSAISTYMKITEGTTPASRGVLRLRAEFEFLKYTIGKVITETLAPFIPKIVEIIKKIRDWIKENKELATKILFWGIVIGFALMWIGMLVLGLKGLAEAFLIPIKGIIKFAKFIRWLSVATKLPMLVIIAVILLIGVIIYSIIQIVRNWGKDWSKVFKWMGIAVLALAGILLLLVSWIPALIAAIVAIVLIGVGYIIQYWDQIKEFFINMWNGIKDFFVGIWNGIVEFLVGIWEKISATVSDYLTAIYNFFEPIIIGIKDFWIGLIDFFSGLWELIKAIFYVAWEWIKYLATEYVIDPVKAAWNAFVEFIDEVIVQPIVNLFKALWEKVVEGWNFIIDKAVEILLPIVEWFKSSIIEPIKDAWEDLKNFVKEVFDKMLGWVKDIIGWIGKALSKAGELLSKGGEAMKGAAVKVRAAAPPPKKQFGGNIIREGLYHLHPGEKVIPSYNVQNTFEGGINITVHTTGGVDPATLADEITAEIRRRI
jgi:phage-related protein